MTEKLLLPFYTVLSTLVYVVLLAGILAIPALFALEANAPLDFVIEDVSVAPASSSDETFAAAGYAPEGWYRIDYRMNVGAAALSPYSYTVEAFALKAPAAFKKTGRFFVAPLERPLSFSRARRDSYLLTVYAADFPDAEAARAFAHEAGFGTRGIVRSFSFFKKELQMAVPGFYAAELT